MNNLRETTKHSKTGEMTRKHATMRRETLFMNSKMTLALTLLKDGQKPKEPDDNPRKLLKPKHFGTIFSLSLDHALALDRGNPQEIKKTHIRHRQENLLKLENGVKLNALLFAYAQKESFLDIRQRFLQKISFTLFPLQLILLSNDISENPGSTLYDNEITIFHLNARSIRNKLDYLQTINNDSSIICITESHLDDRIQNLDIIIPGYH